MNRYTYHPDNDDLKEVYLQASGHEMVDNVRHVLIAWSNGAYISTPVRQIIQLRQDANGYHYDPQLVAELYTAAMAQNNDVFTLGTLSCVQRDRVLELARGVHYEQRSRVNGCRVWIRDLLQEMLKEEIVSQEIFDHVDCDVPLARRRPEI
ncbi:hypothetical protein K443DRAFT_10620 [Laccaria amethystina LaAM-08-1]|uniref:Uncharacterized protein n=1 Tax=Laccaria amethystina LaAM-08-1 TaxID=1095629 RepID=A0A0C9XFQ8_9AGAR|nr:hypothetical protein K443DRAFT_10620 [Laccaria amethystina LaAM-08-1]